jgi:hypothetical protein
MSLAADFDGAGRREIAQSCGTLPEVWIDLLKTIGAGADV